MPRSRIALYGHDSVGLGHLRRNLVLARTLAGLPGRPDVLILSGALEAGSFELPDGVELVKVPGVRKDGVGRYHSRRLRVGLDEAVAIRRGVLAAALEVYAPDLLVVDKSPYGFAGELRPALATLRASGSTRVVLGLRDVLDEPKVARREWRESRINDAIRRDVDEVWIYGDAGVHDLAEACGVPPALRTRVRYTGYLAAGRIAVRSRPPSIPAGVPYVLCALGGGQDGVALANAFVAADLPVGHAGLLVTGPQMRPGDVRAVTRTARTRGGIVIVAFHPAVETWIPGAAAVFTMGGYNAIAEILSTNVPALVVPRRSPRAEQAYRAEALARHDLVDVLAAHHLSPEALTSWVAAAVQRPRRARTGVDLDGLATVAELARGLLDVGRLRAIAV